MRRTTLYGRAIALTNAYHKHLPGLSTCLSRAHASQAHAWVKHMAVTEWGHSIVLQLHMLNCTV